MSMPFETKEPPCIKRGSNCTTIGTCKVKSKLPEELAETFGSDTIDGYLCQNCFNESIGKEIHPASIAYTVEPDNKLKVYSISGLDKPRNNDLYDRLITRGRLLENRETDELYDTLSAGDNSRTVPLLKQAVERLESNHSLDAYDRVLPFERVLMRKPLEKPVTALEKVNHCPRNMTSKTDTVFYFSNALSFYQEGERFEKEGRDSTLVSYYKRTAGVYLLKGFIAHRAFYYKYKDEIEAIRAALKAGSPELVKEALKRITKKILLRSIDAYLKQEFGITLVTSGNDRPRLNFYEFKIKSEFDDTTPITHRPILPALPKRGDK